MSCTPPAWASRGEQFRRKKKKNNKPRVRNRKGRAKNFLYTQTRTTDCATLAGYVYKKRKNRAHAEFISRAVMKRRYDFTAARST